MDLASIRKDNKNKLYAHLAKAKAFIEKEIGYTMQLLELALEKVGSSDGITSKEYRETIDWILDVITKSGALNKGQDNG